MKILKTFISLLLCVLMVAPMAVLPSFAQSDSELKGYIDAAEKLLYSGGTASSRRQLKAAYDISITALESIKSLTKDKEEAIELISKAIEDFVPVESFERVYVAGFDVWNADTVKSFTDTSGCAVFFDTFTVPEGAKSSVKVVTAGSDTAFFSNEGADGGIIGENPLLGDLTNSGGLRIWTSINDVSLAESMSVSVGVRNAQKHTTFTAHNIPVINGYSTIDWEFFTPEYDGVGESISRSPSRE